MGRPGLRVIVDRLETCYGPPEPLKTTHPLEIILLETAAYLAPDARREAAFDALRKRVGTRPEHILAAPAAVLVEICRTGGIHAELRADRMRQIATLTIERFGGDLNRVLDLPSQQALRELVRFPAIGKPGAEKILLFAEKYPVLALESNGLRVLARILFGGEQKNYSATYSSVREALAAETGSDCAWLIRAHQLLRRHGQECCTRNRPACRSCVLRSVCRYAMLNPI